MTLYILAYTVLSETAEMLCIRLTAEHKQNELINLSLQYFLIKSLWAFPSKNVTIKYIYITLFLYTLFYSFNYSPCGVPICLEAKVKTAVGFLVQTDPQFTVAFLEDTHDSFRENGP